MGRKKVRTYKLRLSPEGIGCFLDCHHRIAKSVGEMIPYGMTLYVALSILADGPAAAWLDLDDERLSVRLRGGKTYYVGYSLRIAELTASIGAARNVEGRPGLPVAHLYVLALQCLKLTEDAELKVASERAMQEDLIEEE
jgi:hypothetical protein